MNNIQLEETETVLQIRRGNRDNLGIISIFFHKNISCDPPLEPSHQDGSNGGSQHMFSLRIRKLSLIYFQYPLLFGAPLRKIELQSISTQRF